MVETFVDGHGDVHLVTTVEAPDVALARVGGEDVSIVVELTDRCVPQGIDADKGLDEIDFVVGFDFGEAVILAKAAVKKGFEATVVRGVGFLLDGVHNDLLSQFGAYPLQQLYYLKKPLGLQGVLK